MRKMLLLLFNAVLFIFIFLGRGGGCLELSGLFDLAFELDADKQEVRLSRVFSWKAPDWAADRSHVFQQVPLQLAYRKSFHRQRK